jgi:hypothetical protein
MTQLSQIVNQLQTQRRQVQSELGRLVAAIDALRNGSSASPKARRTMSAAGRRAISLAQKARWAKRAAKGTAGSTRPKRTMSAAARRKIANAQKARWAAWKANHKNAA